MKKMCVYLIMTILNIGIIVGQTKYKENRDFFIENHLVKKMNEEFHVNVMNKNRDRTLILKYVIVSIKGDTIINEFGGKEVNNKHVRIYDANQLRFYEKYEFIYAEFVDKRRNLKYQTTYTFNHKDTIKNVNFKICFKIKNKTGNKKKLNYLHIKTF